MYLVVQSLSFVPLSDDLRNYLIQVSYDTEVSYLKDRSVRIFVDRY